MRALFLANPTASTQQNPILCVGEKTKSLLEENGQKVIKTLKYARISQFYSKNNEK